tara:strand:+ start:255 stop:527 length:273 start_codon:yes stop_codon:yes gene_type:complete
MKEIKMLLYLETELDDAYKIDCKERTNKDKPWIKRESFRSLYENLIELYLKRAEESGFADIDLEDVPAWVLGEVERTLQADLEISLEDNT